MSAFGHRRTIVQDDAPRWFDPDEVEAMLGDTIVDDVELIDVPVVESATDRFIESLSQGAGPDSSGGSTTTSKARTLHAAPLVAPAIQSWGVGTDGWPRRNSRVIQLFHAPDLADRAAGKRFGPLRLERTVVDDGDGRMTIPGRLWMPYAAPPLRVELVLAPFTSRYTRAELVLTSTRRFPRRYFDVACRSLRRVRTVDDDPLTAWSNA